MKLPTETQRHPVNLLPEDVVPALIWIDIESTCLDPDKGHLLEVHVHVTNRNLETLREHGTLVLPPEDYKEKCDEKVTEMHTKSGLFKEIDRCRESNMAQYFEPAQAEELLLQSLQTLNIVPEMEMDQRPVLAGSSVGFDRRWLKKHMPKLADCLHYRTLDVSGLKVICQLFFPDIDIPPKGEAHRAKEDIQESMLLFHYLLQSIGEHFIENAEESSHAQLFEVIRALRGSLRQTIKHNGLIMEQNLKLSMQLLDATSLAVDAHGKMADQALAAIRQAGGAVVEGKVEETSA